MYTKKNIINRDWEGNTTNVFTYFRHTPRTARTRPFAPNTAVWNCTCTRTGTRPGCSCPSRQGPTAERTRRTPPPAADETATTCWCRTAGPFGRTTSLRYDAFRLSVSTRAALKLARFETVVRACLSQRCHRLNCTVGIGITTTDFGGPTVTRWRFYGIIIITIIST